MSEMKIHRTGLTAEQIQSGGILEEGIVKIFKLSNSRILIRNNATWKKGEDKDLLTRLPLKIGRKWHPLTWRPGWASQQGKERKEETSRVKTQKQIDALLAENTIACAEDSPEVSTKKLLELISKFSRVVPYDANIQKSTAFLDTSNNQSLNKKEFAVSKGMKHSGKFDKHVLIMEMDP